MLSFAGLFIMNLQLNTQAQLWPVSEKRNRKIQEMGRLVMQQQPAIRNSGWTIGKKNLGH